MTLSPRSSMATGWLWMWSCRGGAGSLEKVVVMGDIVSKWYHKEHAYVSRSVTTRGKRDSALKKWYTLRLRASELGHSIKQCRPSLRVQPTDQITVTQLQTVRRGIVNQLTGRVQFQEGL